MVSYGTLYAFALSQSSKYCPAAPEGAELKLKQILFLFWKGMV